MATLQELADDLARDALAVERDEDDPIVSEIAKVIGASSNTLEEAFITAVRIRRAEARGRELIEDRLMQGPDGDMTTPDLSG